MADTASEAFEQAKTTAEEATAEAAEEVKDELMKAADSNWILVVFVLLIVGAISALMIRMILRKNADDEYFQSLIPTYDFEVPAEVDMYYDLKDKNLEDKKPLRDALMRRAIACIPLVMFVEKEAHGVACMHDQGMIPASSWKNFKSTESFVNREVASVQAEAEALQAGWGRLIWYQAVQFRKMLEERQQQAQKVAEASKEEKKDNKKKPAKKEETAEQKAERIAKELITEEESQQKKKAKAGAAAKKK